MRGIKPVKQQFVPAAALAVVKCHEDYGKDAEPFIIGSKHLREHKTRCAAQLQIDHAKLKTKCYSGPDNKTQPLVKIQRIQHNAAQQVGPAAIGDG